MKHRFLLIVSTILVFAFASAAFAQGSNEKVKLEGFKAEAVGLITFAEGRYVQLAEAIPADKYDYRPGEGVRSFREVLTHMIQANYGLPNVIGVKPPADAPKNVNELKDKTKIIELLKGSFEHTRQAVRSVSLETPVKFFGNDTTHRGVISFMSAHTNQHLGQLIAYARVNGITPPWNANQGN